MTDRTTEHLLRRLLGVMLGDAATCGLLSITAVATQGRPSGPEYASIARVALFSFLPGAIGVLRECDVHRRSPAIGHSVTCTVLLFIAGAVINTVGTSLILARGRRARTATAVDIALLIGGDAIGVPYLVTVGALHSRRRHAGARWSHSL